MAEISKREEKKFEKEINEINFDYNEQLNKTYILCIEDSNKYRFKTLKEHTEFYFNEVYKIMENHDFMVMYIAYGDYIINKFGNAYYYNHRELETFLALLSLKSKRKKFINFKEIYKDIPTVNELKKLEITLRKINTLFFLREDTSIQEKNLIDELYSIFKSPERMTRFKTNYIRNEGSGNQYLNYIKEVLNLLSKKNIRRNKYEINKLVDGFIELINLPTQSKRKLFKGTKYSKVFFTILNDMFFIEKTKKLDYIKLFFLKRSSFFISMIKFHTDAFYKNNELEEIFGDGFLAHIDSLSIELGKNTIEEIWLDNPIWGRPFIKLSNDSYIYPIPTLPLTFAEQITLNILETEESDTYHLLKTSKFMENKILSLLKKYAGFNIYHSLKFEYDGKKYETDFLILYKNIAIIIEAKGHNLNKKGKMGEPRRLENRIRKIIEEANMQADRLKKVIKYRRQTTDFFSKDKKIDIDLTSIDEIVTLSISFEWLIFFSTSMHNLREKYKIVSGHTHCSLAEFEDIVDILETEDQFAMYFFKRKLLERSNIKLKSDELDLVTYFVKNGFSFKENDFGFFDITGEFDKSSNSYYFMKKHILKKESLTKFDEYFFKNSEKLTFKYTPFIKKHLEYLRMNKNKSFYLTGFFETIPYRIQKEIEETLIKKFNEIKFKVSVYKIRIKVDFYSDEMIAIMNYRLTEDEIEEYIRKLSVKKNSRNGLIIVLYEIIYSKIQISKIIYKK